MAANSLYIIHRHNILYIHAILEPKAEITFKKQKRRKKKKKKEKY